MNPSPFLLLLGIWIFLSPPLFAQNFDLSSGGLPTVTGSTSVNVTANPMTTQDLNVSINLGDVSPVNSSGTIKIVVPVAVRSIVPYQVSINSSGSFGANPRAFQAADIGFGAQNIRSMGVNSAPCTLSTHDFRNPFNNDPLNGISYDSNGRARYVSSVSDIGVSSVILSGPRLSADSGPSVSRNPDNGYIFDVIFVVKPQFYAPGNFNVNLTLSISDGPSVPC